MNNKKGLELGVGIFLLIGLACMAYLSFRLGDVSLFGRSTYTVHARFSNVGGLAERSAVTIAGVNVGSVERIGLKDDMAYVTLRINDDVKIEDDAIASIKTMGIIGEKFIAISHGASTDYVQPGGEIRDTQPPVDLEELLGKYVFGKV